MPSADVIDFAKLTAPIPGDNEAGDGDKNKYVVVRDLLKTLRSEHNPADYEAGTPESAMEKREPNWPRLVSEATNHLASKSKNIEFAARMCEGLLMQYGFVGVRDGIKLLRLLFEEAWDRMYPAIEEPEDGELRTQWLDWLDPWDKSACYPTRMRKAPLFGALSYQNWKDSSGDLEAAAKATDLNKIQQLIDDLTAAKEELQGLVAIAKTRVSSWSLSMGNVETAINDCLTLAKQAQQKVSPTFEAVDGAMVPASEGGAMSISGGIQTVSVGASRQQIYDAINRFAELLEKIEPHSPVPMLLRKIVNLGPMNFHKLVEELTRDQRVLDFMKPLDEQSASGY